MKTILLTAFTLVIGNVLAQLPVGTAPQNKKAFLEEFTGINCTWCPAGHVIANQIYAADPNNVVIVNIHSGTFATANTGQIDLKTADGTAIDQMPGMGITGYPAGTMNRKVLSGTVMAGSRSLWTGWANTVKAQSAYCNVALQGTLDPQTRVLTVQVEVYYTANSPVATNSINVFLLEDKIKGTQTNGSGVNLSNYNADGTYNHNHVLRKALTPTFGLTIPNATMGALFTTTLAYTIPATYGATGKTTTPNFENLELVGFVTQTDRDIINAATGPIVLTKDAKALGVNTPLVCGNNVSPVVSIKNNGLTAITDLTITPSIDGVSKAPTSWNGNLAAGATINVTLNPIATTGGGHALSYVIAGDFFTPNNTGSGNYFAAADFQGTPVSQGFVTATFPPALWGMVNTDNGFGWSRKTNVGAYNLSTTSCKYDFFKNTVIGDKDELYLPPMDLSGAAAPDMIFDLAYAQRNSSDDDALDVFVSDNCGDNWTNVYNSHGAALSNLTSPVGSEYVPSPSDPTEWRTEQISLAGFNKPNVLVKFVVTNDNGNNLYLDNINLSQANPTGIKKTSSQQISVGLYPNPTNGLTTVRISADKMTNAKISLVNMLGQTVITKEVSMTEGYEAVELDMKEQATGIYNVVISSGNGSVVKKLNLTK